VQSLTSFRIIHKMAASLTGCFERHLLRQKDNPLFGSPQFDTGQIKVAQQQDYQEAQKFVDQFTSTVEEIANLPDNVESDIILKLKNDIEKLYEESCRFESSFSAQKEALLKLYHLLYDKILASVGDDQTALGQLKNEKIAHDLNIELLKHSLVSDLLRQDSPIQQNQLIACLLNEEIDALEMVANLFDPQQLDELIHQAKLLIKQQDNEVVEQRQLTKKIKLLTQIADTYNDL
jgi:hypothetical protein